MSVPFASVLLAALLVAAVPFPAAAQSTPPASQPATPLPSPSAPGSPPVPALPSSSPAPAPSGLGVTPQSVALAPGQTQTLQVLGATGPVNATLAAPLADIQVDPATQAVTLTARVLGQTTLHLTDASGATLDVPIAVMPWAGIIPPAVELTVTGDPATPEFLEAQARGAVYRALRPTLQPGASIQYGPISPAPQALGSGFVTSLTVPVTVVALGAIAAQGTATVNVTDAAVPPVDPTLLFFDDDPENVGADGVTFRGQVDANHPARLYYYHQDLGSPRRLLVVFTTAGTTPARVQLIDAAGGPNLDVMSVGHAVTRSVLVEKPANDGLVADIAPGTPFVLRSADMTPAEVAAGSVDVQVLQGGPVTLTVIAIGPQSHVSAYLDSPLLAGDGHHRRGTFTLGDYGEMRVAYTVGGPDASTAYGGRDRMPQNVDGDSDDHDFGDYGVLQNITFDVANPTGAPATLYLYERPLGGGARNIFLVDGELHNMGCARLPQRYQISTVQAAPQSNTEVHLLTMTDGGSSYPLEVGISATPPIPETPPINAPDGCFPKSG